VILDLNIRGWTARVPGLSGPPRGEHAGHRLLGPGIRGETAGRSTVRVVSKSPDLTELSLAIVNLAPAGR